MRMVESLVSAYAYEAALDVAALLTGDDRDELRERAGHIAATLGVTALAAIRIIVDTHRNTAPHE